MKAILIDHRLSKEEIDCFLRDLICELYDKVYTQNFTINRLWPIGYEVKIPLSNSERPLVIAIEAEGEKYFKLLRQAVQESNLCKASFFSVSLTGFTDDIDVNKVKGKEAIAHYNPTEDELYLIGRLADKDTAEVEGDVKNTTILCEE